MPERVEPVQPSLFGDAPPAEQAASETHAAPATESIADGREKMLDPATIQAWRLGGAVSSAVVLGLLLMFTVVQVVVLSSVPAKLAFLGITGLAFLAFATMSFLWPNLRYRHTYYRIDEQGLWIRRGVLWRSELMVPRSRVQHTDVSQGPIERNFGLASLIVHTAGTRNASVSLGGLAREDADKIRDHLIVGGEGDAV